MLELFDAILSFLVLGRDSPFAFRHRPLWQRIPLVILSLLLAVGFAAIVTVLLFLIGTIVIRLLRGSGS